jgi:thioredoxin reductase (NADPH)
MGAEHKKLGVPGEEELGGRGVSYCATCDAAFFKDRETIIVGGGDSAMEEAIFLAKFADHVTVVNRRDEFRASKIMLDRALTNPRIEWVTNAQVVEVLGAGESTGRKVTGAILEDTRTGERRTIAATGIFIAIGHQPNSQPFKGLLDMDDTGYILTHDGTHTSVDGVFAAGDVQDKVYRQAVTAAGTGCMAAIDAERWLESRHHAASHRAENVPG